MSQPTNQLLASIHQQTLGALQRDLERAYSVDALLALTEAALQHTSQTVEGVLQASGIAMDCAAGCSFCCWLWIDVQAHEVLLIARHLRASLAEEELETLLVAARKRRAGLGLRGNSSPCVLLRNGMCSVYAVRPGACRRYYSRDVSECQRLWVDPSVKATVENSLIADTGRAVGGAVNRAFAEAGFDATFYELTAALVEALEDPGCEERWLRRERVFAVPTAMLTDAAAKRA